MATKVRGGVEIEGGGWETVEYSRSKGSQKRGASSERPEVMGDNKLRKMGELEESIVLYKIKGQKEGAGGFRALNPLKVAAALENQIGKGFQAKILSNGLLKICCKDIDQYNSAKMVGKLVAKVECITPKERKGVKGVVYGIWSGMTEKEILDNIKGGQVIEAKRLKSREGGNWDSPVLLVFAGDVLPTRVYLGCMSYQVREYIRPPLRCYNCQRFGHVAGSCRGKRRCMKCGEDHDIKACKAVVPKCSNCGGDHIAAFRGCEYFSKAKQIQDVSIQQKISYAEAVKKVDREQRISKEKIGMMGSQYIPSPPTMVASGMLLMTKESFLAFVVDVLVGARTTTKRSDMIKVVVGAAERFLDIKQISPEKLHEYMTDKQSLNTSQLSGSESTEELYVDEEANN